MIRRLLVLPYALLASVFLAGMDYVCRDIPVALATFEASL